MTFVDLRDPGDLTAQQDVIGSVEPEGPGTEIPPEIVTAISDIQGFFTENRGQLDEEVRFHAAGDPLSIYLGVGWMAYRLQGDDGTISVVRVDFEGSNPMEPVGGDVMGHRTSYIIGRDPGGWVSDAHSYREVVYVDIWESIDLRLFLSNDRMKYEFVVRPGGNVESISMAYSGTTRLFVDPDSGALRIVTPSGTLIDDAPRSFQKYTGEVKDVTSHFRLSMASTIGFSTGPYDDQHNLVIDPGLEFSSFFGGSGNDGTDRKDALVIGSDGSVYVGGSTGSQDLPVTQGAFCSTFHTGSGLDIFVAKFDHNISNLLFCTYVGGIDHDVSESIVLTPNGSLVIAGYTFSSDFPISANSYDGTLNGNRDAFILGLSSNGSTLSFSTLLGGSNDDICWDIVAHGNDRIYGIISTTSMDFPTTPNVYCSTLAGNYDTAVFEFDSRNQSLVHSTYFGGTDEEAVRSLVLRSDGSVVIGGYTASIDLPTTIGAFDEDYNGGDYDAWVTAMGPNLSKVEFCTYIGGKSFDSIEAIILDENEDIWFAGHTDSNDLFVTIDAYQSTFGGGGPVPTGGGDAFLGKLSANGANLIYESYFGGNTQDWADDIELGPDGNPVIMGTTTSTNLFFPTSAYMSTCNLSGNNGFLAWIDYDDNILLNGTYMGGDSNNLWANLEHDQNWTWVFTGTSWGPEFLTTPGAYNTQSNGWGDAVIVGISMEVTPRIPPSVPLNLTPAPGDGWVNLTWDLPERDGNWPIEKYR
ncbi:MAG: hypothetical protein GQ558_04450, partial [Thermoplasmata archaeon]|nr:hypothetical protein [Thermoplasmata archaeon]